MSSDQANQAADAILALINSRPQSPSKEEIAVLIDRIANPHRPAPPDELRSGARYREQDGVDGWLERQQWTSEEVQQIKLRQQIKRELIEDAVDRIKGFTRPLS